MYINTSSPARRLVRTEFAAQAVEGEHHVAARPAQVDGGLWAGMGERQRRRGWQAGRCPAGQQRGPEQQRTAEAGPKRGRGGQAAGSADTGAGAWSSFTGISSVTLNWAVVASLVETC